MKELFLNNGWIIKAYFEDQKEVYDFSYYGIQRGVTWPLDIYKDALSKALTDEAIHRWLGYQDNRPWCIPDVDYILRYMKHCQELDIYIRCFQIESSNSLIIANEDLPIYDILGYEYVDLDMNTSCLFDDLICLKDFSYENYEKLQKRLNQYGLFKTKDELYSYIKMRDSFRNSNLEEYYSPLGIRLKLVDMKVLINSTGFEQTSDEKSRNGMY